MTDGSLPLFKTWPMFCGLSSRVFPTPRAVLPGATGKLAAAVMVAASFPAHADSYRQLCDGAGYVWIEQDGSDYIVSFHNGFVTACMDEPITLTMDEFSVVVTLEYFDWRIPDTMTVTPPIGWRSEPTVAVDEEGTGSIRVTPEALS